MTIIEARAEILLADNGEFPPAGDPRWATFLNDLKTRSVITEDGTALRPMKMLRGMGPPNNWLLRIEIEDTP